MDSSRDDDVSGAFKPRYVAFLETITHLRPRLHRYCSRMIGSVLDGEDLVQEALFQAYRKLETFDDDRPLAPWLFRIAHNRCIDFLRRRGIRQEAETAAAASAGRDINDDHGAFVELAALKGRPTANAKGGRRAGLYPATHTSFTPSAEETESRRETQWP